MISERNKLKDTREMSESVTGGLIKLGGGVKPLWSSTFELGPKRQGPRHAMIEGENIIGRRGGKYQCCQE